MKNPLTQLTPIAGTLLVLLTVSSRLEAGVTQTYTGNGNTSGGGIIGQSTMTLEDRGSSLHGVIDHSTYGWSDAVVIYIDCRAGGFGDNMQFFDASIPRACAISGFSWDNTTPRRARANFAPGFTADFALVLSPEMGSGLYELAAGGDGSLIQRRSFSVEGTMQFSINWSDLGITGDAAHYLRFSSTICAFTGARRMESYESINGVGGFNTVNWANFNEFGIAPVPEPVNMALAGLGGVLMTGGVVSQLRRRAGRRKAGA